MKYILHMQILSGTTFVQNHSKLRIHAVFTENN